MLPQFPGRGPRRRYAGDPAAHDEDVTGVSPRRFTGAGTPNRCSRFGLRLESLRGGRADRALLRRFRTFVDIAAVQAAPPGRRGFGLFDLRFLEGLEEILCGTADRTFVGRFRTLVNVSAHRAYPLTHCCPPSQSSVPLISVHFRFPYYTRNGFEDILT